MSDDLQVIVARVHGRVQGVSFRVWTLGQAQQLGLDGWVRNLPDGSVEAMISGPTSAVSDMVERLRQGPRAAKVSEVVVLPAEPGHIPAGFRITG